ncbi:polyprenyl synthetase family protein [Kribbella solani]|uniref:Geranylgeranyl diphosphate synthase type I n=1 Tax=Kribbella solani TaxID=236067 RepID=A0A841DUE0_9ACTN|nr:geranylgeranyl diphosphate synthase type I [Kribbella solani]
MTAYAGTEAVTRTRQLVTPALRKAVATLPTSTRRIGEYHLGWTDKDGAPSSACSGKLIRSTLTLLAAEAVGGTAGPAIPMAVAVELVHNFTLLHDDVMDGDRTRRHRETAWSVFGTGPAIMAGDALLSLAFQAVAESGAAARAIGDTVQQLIEGQLADCEFETCKTIRYADCVAMAQRKTGALLSCAAELGGLSAGASPEQTARLRRFGAEVGLAYQYVDDLLGIWGDPAVTGKPVFNDLRRRKKSLPVAAALESRTAEGEEFGALYAARGELTTEQLARAAYLVEKTGARDHCQARANELMASAPGHLRSIASPDPPVSRSVARAIAELGNLARLAARRES